MLNFLKDNSYTIFKMLVNQIGMTIFGIVLSMATSQNDTLHLIASIFSILFYMVLLYTMTWDIGYEEKNRIDHQRLKYRPLKGFYMSLVANIPNLIFGILFVVGRLSIRVFDTEGIPLSPAWAVNMMGVAKTLISFLEGMYNGLLVVAFGNAAYAHLLIVLPALVTCTLAYIAGVKGFHLLPVNPNKQNRE